MNCLRRTGEDRYRAESAAYRVQLTVCDLGAAKYGPARIDAPPSFTVQALPQSAHRFSSFASGGQLLYHGESLAAAMRAITEILGPVEIHPNLKRYEKEQP